MNPEKYMKRAISLAMKGSGKVSPNPKVGAVIVKDGEIIAEGYHRKYGEDHAEVDAIKKAGLDDFTGATMYVNLEPCSHTGKTPPCAPLLVEKKFSKVVIAMQDPNPQVAGSGIQILKDGGVEVEQGVLEEDAKWQNRFFIKHIQTGHPYIIAKAAQSFDGIIASKSGESKWISSEESRKRVHILRSIVDAVMVGRKTAHVDNPELTVRHVKGRQPWRIIIDKDLNLGFDLKLFHDKFKEKTILISSEKNLSSHRASTLKFAQIKTLAVPTDEDGQLDLKHAFKLLSDEYNINSIMIEGGAGLLSYCMKEDLIDELQLFIAPKIFGQGVSTFSNYKLNSLKDAPGFKIRGLMQSDTDIHMIAVKE